MTPMPISERSEMTNMILLFIPFCTIEILGNRELLIF
jgi:hypothetical protein